MQMSFHMSTKNMFSSYANIVTVAVVQWDFIFFLELWTDLLSTITGFLDSLMGKKLIMAIS